MSKVYADAVATPEPTDDLTLGGSGDNVIVTAGATLKTNTIKDSGGNTLWTSDGSGNISNQNSAIASSNMVLLSTQAVTNQASVSITSSIDNTYKLYIFKLINFNPVDDGVSPTWQVNVDGGSGFNETITSTYFRAYLGEVSGGETVDYNAGSDQAQGTAYQRLCHETGNGADENASGELWLFNPSNTTYVKHFLSTMNNYVQNNASQVCYAGGYVNTTAAIDEISFKYSSGNFDGTIKMYGVG